MVNILIITLLVMPWIFIPHPNIVDQFRLPQATVMDICFLSIIAYSLRVGQRYVYRNKYLALLTGWVFLNFFYYFFIPFSLQWQNGRAINIWILEPMLHYFLALFATIIVLSNFDKEDFIRIAKAICISGTLISIFSILQYTGFDPLKTIARYTCANRVSACLDNPNVVGNYLALSFPLFLMFKNWKYYLSMLIVALGIFVTKSHFAIFLGSLGLVIYFTLYFWRKKIISISIFSGFFLGFAFLIEKLDFAKLSWNLSGRLETWKVAIDHLKDNVLLGQGMGIWKSWEVYIRTTTWLSVHNDWLERTIELGVVGLFLIILVVINSIKNFNYKGETNFAYFSMFIVFLVMMLGSFPLETASIAILGLISFWAVEKL